MLREIRKKDDMLVIMLIVCGEDDDKIFGFEFGVDDYVVKFVSFKEIVVCVKVILKRIKKFNLNDILFIDKVVREVYVKG